VEFWPEVSRALALTLLGAFLADRWSVARPGQSDLKMTMKN